MKKLLYISLLLILTSCDAWLVVEPENSVPADKALETISGNRSTLMAAYSKIQSADYYGRQMMAATEVMADNAKIAKSHNNKITAEGQNNIGAHCNIWTISYKAISNANFVIDAIDKIPNVLEKDAYTKQLIKGEAYFLRGWQHFELTRVYARESGYLANNFDLGVIVQTEPFVYDGSNIGDAEKSRSTVEESYNQIIEDLDKAFSLLENNDEGNFPNRGSALAAKALLARVYLYREDFENAAKAADWVIEHAGAYGIALEKGDYKNVFSTGKENILQIIYTETDNLGTSSMQSIYSNTGLLEPKPADPDWYRDEKLGSGIGDVLFSIELYNKFEKGDKRQSVFKKVIRAANSSTPEKGIWCYKFNGYNGVFGLDNIPVIRLSEMYHIRIEANLRKDHPNEEQAVIDLNEMRGARGLAPVKDLTGTALLQQAELEYRLEFLGEGHRFFELKRKGLNITKSPECLTAGGIELSWDDPRVVARIPLADAQPNGSNPNLVQNPGY